MSDSKIAAIARRYVWALDEPGPREGFDSISDYYTAGSTSDKLLDQLRAAVNEYDEELSAAFDAVRPAPKTPDQEEWDGPLPLA